MNEPQKLNLGLVALSSVFLEFISDLKQIINLVFNISSFTACLMLFVEFENIVTIQFVLGLLFNLFTNVHNLQASADPGLSNV